MNEPKHGQAELVLAAEALRITGMTSELFYKLVRAGTITRFQPTPEMRSRYYRTQLLKLVEPPAEVVPVAGTGAGKSIEGNRNQHESVSVSSEANGQRGSVAQRDARTARR